VRRLVDRIASLIALRGTLTSPPRSIRRAGGCLRRTCQPPCEPDRPSGVPSRGLPLQTRAFAAGGSASGIRRSSSTTIWRHVGGVVTRAGGRSPSDHARRSAATVAQGAGPQADRSAAQVSGARIVPLAAAGWANQAITHKLGIAPNTVQVAQTFRHGGQWRPGRP
jgi:hypothetical protein